MNDYVTLDNKRYKTLHGKWIPVLVKPGTARRLLSGSIDVAYGPSHAKEWRGIVLAPVTPISGSYGSIADLRASLQETNGLAFQDHYGDVAYMVHALGEFPEESLSPKWDATQNEFRVMVRLIAENTP